MTKAKLSGETIIENHSKGKINIFANSKVARAEDTWPVEVVYGGDTIIFTLRKVPARTKYRNFQACMKIGKDGANMDIEAYYSKMLAEMIVHNTATDSSLSEQEVGDMYDEIFDALVSYVPNPVLEINKPEFIDELKKK